MRCVRRPGFTLVEVVLVIGILAFLLLLILVITTSAIGKGALQGAENILVQSLRRAQTLSQNNVGRAQHGVYIKQGESVIVFSGANFSVRNPLYDQTYEINPRITFDGALYLKMVQTPPAPSGAGIGFVQLTGEPVPANFSGAITMTLDSETRTVTVSGKGVTAH